MLAACKEFDVRLQLRHDILPVAEDAVDFVTAVCVYHHIPPPERLAFTREALRVLKPGGVFCIIEHNPWNPATQLIVRRTPVDAKAQLLTARSARGLLRHADARVIATEFFLYLPESLYRAAGALERALARIPLGGQYAVFGQKCTRP
jgi:SAM-dependent methyltransferase